MCGIAGLVNFNNKKIENDFIEKTLKSLNHRGPDSKGSWISKCKTSMLCNTRLAIIDPLLRSNQPIISNDDRFVIVFNGEIYNFQEIKKKLKDFKFKTNGDTEVILYSYIKYGKNCVKLFDGIFSFVIFDKISKKLFCSRDPFGIKPLYYFINKDFFFFASEIQTLFLHKQIKKEVNYRSVNSYLSSEYYENIKKTFFKKINKLKPGNYLELQNKKIKEVEYWNFFEKCEKTFVPKNQNEKKELLKFLVKNSVKKSLVSDTKISVAASGGLDSSILQNIAKSKLKTKPELFSFFFENTKYSEQNYVKNLSKNQNINVKYQRITPDLFLKYYKEVMSCCEEPMAGLPIISYYLALKKLNVSKVILDGSGIDECHFGYEKYLSIKKNSFILSQDNSHSIHKNIIHENLKSNFQNYDNEIDFNHYKKNYQNLMYKDLFYIKLPRALRFRDRIGMSNGIEIRPSFLDKDLIPFMFKLDKNDHFRDGHQKFLLRSVFSSDINQKIIFSKKRNIQTPQSEWFKKDLKPWLDKKLKNSNIWDYKIFNKKIFLEKYNEFQDGKLNNSFFIWKFINLENFISQNKN